MGMETRVMLRRTEDEQGLRNLWAVLADDDGLRFEGQDLGSGVESVFGAGFTEYEYGMTVRAVDVPRLLAALGAETDILSALQQYFGDPHAEDPASFLKQHAIPYEFWSRIGD